MMARLLSRRAALPQASDKAPALRFAAHEAVAISNADELACMKPGFVQSLSGRFQADALSSRLNPVLLEDGSIAIFALSDHVGSDQADELSRRIAHAGYKLAQPSRYVLSAPLLLAIGRHQLTAQSLAGAADINLHHTRTALANAFQDIVEWGVRHGASDIHLNVHAGQAESEVKFTVAGRYLAPERFRRLPTSTLVEMLSVAWMDIRGGNGAVFDPSIEQQGSIVKRVGTETVMLRWASLAADAGPSICLRVLRRSADVAIPNLEALGYLPEQVRQIDRVMLSEGGAVVFAGTVGAGKSTSLASLISRLPPQRKVITVEDPVEYLIPGAIQNTLARNLDVAAHEVYGAKLRALKRSAMTDVLLGEIRDNESGRAFMDLAGSGVNVYTTVHAPSAALIAQRLSSDFIGVSPDFLSTPGVLKLLVFQVLLPVLCPHCALPADHLLQGADHPGGGYRSGRLWADWLQLIRSLYPGLPHAWRIRNPQGCPACAHAALPELHGYAGRSVAAELIEPAISPLPSRSAMDCAVSKGAAGTIDPRDIEVRFQAFETLHLASGTSEPAAGSARLRAVP